MSDWRLEPGDRVQRKDLQAEYGGRTQGGIGPSKQTPNVFVFSDPASGEKHGYFDGWKDDGNFHYTGEGQRGDQVMKSGNAAILNHEKEGRALRVFDGARGEVTYVGEFRCIDWYETDAPETGGGPIRKVIVFVLQPVDVEPIRPPGSESVLTEVPTDETRVDVVPIEQNTTERTYVDPSRDTYVMERKESELVQAFAAKARRRGLQVTRLRIVPPHESKPIFNDILLDDGDWMIEAKGSVTRENVRMALGQLLDYRRFHRAENTAVLLPSSPRPDLQDLITRGGATAVWLDGGDFVTPEGPFFD